MDPRTFRVEKHGSARFSDRKTWIRTLFGSKNMDPRTFWVEKHGSAHFSGRKTWIRALFGSKSMDPRAFRVEKHGSAGSIRWALCHVFDLGLPPNAPKRLAQCHVLFSNPRLLTKTQTQSDDPFRRYLYHFPLCYLLVRDRIR